MEARIVRFEDGLSVADVLDILYDDYFQFDSADIYVEPPEPSVLTDEDSADEDDADIEHLSRNQLLSRAEVNIIGGEGAEERQQMVEARDAVDEASAEEEAAAAREELDEARAEVDEARAEVDEARREIINLRHLAHAVCDDIVAVTADGPNVMKKLGRIIPSLQQFCYAHGIQLAVIDVLYQKRGIEEVENIVDSDQAHTAAQVVMTMMKIRVL
ncbi:hypothetical protein WDU94_010782 [Cyamophila willieti]